MNTLHENKLFIEVYQNFNCDQIINILSTDLSQYEIAEFIAELAKRCDKDWTLYEAIIKHFEAVKLRITSVISEDDEIDFTPELLTKGI